MTTPSYQANRLLAALPKSEYQVLQPYLEPVRLARGQVIYEPQDDIKHVWFITSGVVSLLAASIEGQTLEVGLIGNEGLVGIPVLMQIKRTMFRVVAQTDVEALRIKSVTLSNEFRLCGRLHQVLMRYLHVLMVQLTQSALCNNFHDSEQRLARWLLTMQDKVGSNPLPMTHEMIAQMMGKPRARVTTTMTRLHQKGLVRSRSGRVFILDRSGLEAAACECYQIINDEVKRFLEF
jgi:CRP-like cAMP-binding protein